MSSEVKTYFLSPEELEKYRQMKPKIYPHEHRNNISKGMSNWEWPKRRKERERKNDEY